MSPRPSKLRFGLRTLLWATTGIASLIGLWRVSPGAVIFLVTVAHWLILLRVVALSSPLIVPAGSRHSQCTCRFWRAFWITLPFAAALNLTTYWVTYDSPRYDGCAMIGWPAPFLARCGGNTAFQYYAPFDLSDLAIDLITPLAISAAAGMALQGGVRRLRMRIARFLLGRT